MRPNLPLQRVLPGAVGQAVTEARDYLRRLHEREHLWGNEVTVSFSAPSTPTRVVTGLPGPARGYHLVRASADTRVWDAAVPSSETDRTALWIQASVAGSVTLWIY